MTAKLAETHIPLEERTMDDRGILRKERWPWSPPHNYPAPLSKESGSGGDACDGQIRKTTRIETKFESR